jgi:poly(A) polymerase
LRIRYGKKENGAMIKKAVVYTQEEHKINFADVDRDAVFITSRLRANGFETYIVGGAVRDLMLGKKPKDFDIVTEAVPARIRRIFHNSRIIGRRFRLVHVFFGPKIFEVSTFRSLKDGHTSNTYGTIEEDVLRRDFSLNALFYDPEKRVVVDYVNGMADMKRRRIRPIIPADLIFKDDPVRMIRAVKYAAATGFSIPWLLRRRIKKEAGLLDAVSPSRRTEELFKIIHSPYTASIVRRLEEAGLFTCLQSEASALIKSSPDFQRSYFRSLEALEKLNEKDEASEETALASLIRDYMETACDWEEYKKAGPAACWEDYKTAFFTARRFILPMNPPRTALEMAVRLIFAGHELELKKIRLFEGRRPAARPGRREAAADETPGEKPRPSTGTRPRKRSRRRKKPANNE